MKKIILLLAIFYSVKALSIPSKAVECITPQVKCSEEPNQFNYEKDVIYVYDYESETETGILNINDNMDSNFLEDDLKNRSISVRIKMQFSLQKLNSCTMQLMISSVPKIIEYHENGANQLDTRNLQIEQVINKPLIVSYQGGKIEGICHDELGTNELTWSLNIKKAVASSFQNLLNGLNEPQTFQETDFMGQCETNYEPYSNMGSNRFIIIKTKNLASCERNTVAQNLVFKKHKQKTKSLKLINGIQCCTQTYESNQLKSHSCKENHVIEQLRSGNEGISTFAKWTLKLVSQTKIHSFQELNNPQKGSIMFDDYFAINSNSGTGLYDAKQVLKHLCGDHFDINLEKNMPEKFSELIQILRDLNYDNFVELKENINLICPANSDAFQILIDALSNVGTEESIRFMAENANEIKSYIDNQPLISLNSQLNHLKVLTQRTIPWLQSMLLKGGINIYLPISAVINDYCQICKNCSQNKEIQQIVNIFVEKIKENYKSEDSSHDQRQIVLHSLMSIGNIGIDFDGSVTQVLTDCIKHSKCNLIKIKAMEAFRKFNCSTSMNILEDVYSNTFSNDTEVRIGAYTQLMRCENENTLNLIKKVMKNERSIQVGSFVLSDLQVRVHNHQYSYRFTDQLIQLINDIKESHKFDKAVDGKRFSNSNSFSDIQIPIIMGFLRVDTKVIFTHESFMPRKLSANFFLDAFGSISNPLQVDLRFSHFDSLLEYLLTLNPYKEPNNFKNSTSSNDDDSSRIKNTTHNKNYPLVSLCIKKHDNEIYFSEMTLSELYSKTFPASVINSKIGKLFYSKNILLIDQKHVIPIGSGHSLILSLNASASANSKFDGIFDVYNFPKSLNIDGGYNSFLSLTVSANALIDVGVDKPGISFMIRNFVRKTLNGVIKYKDFKLLKIEYNSPGHNHVSSSQAELKLEAQNFNKKIAFSGTEKNIERKFCNYFSQTFGFVYCVQSSFPTYHSFTHTNLLSNFYIKIYLKKIDHGMRSWQIQVKNNLENQEDQKNTRKIEITVDVIRNTRMVSENLYSSLIIDEHQRTISLNVTQNKKEKCITHAQWNSEGVLLFLSLKNYTLDAKILKHDNGTILNKLILKIHDKELRISGNSNRIIGEGYEKSAVNFNLESNYPYVNDMSLIADNMIIQNDENKMGCFSTINFNCGKSKVEMNINASFTKNMGDINGNASFDIYSTYECQEYKKNILSLTLREDTINSNTTASLSVKLPHDNDINLNITLNTSLTLLDLNIVHQLKGVHLNQLNWIHFCDHTSSLKEYLMVNLENKILLINLQGFYESESNNDGLKYKKEQIKLLLQVDGENNEVIPLNVSGLINYQKNNSLLIGINSSCVIMGESFILFNAEYSNFPKELQIMIIAHSPPYWQNTIHLSSSLNKSQTNCSLNFKVNSTFDDIKTLSIIGNISKVNDSFIGECDLQHNDNQVNIRKNVTNIANNEFNLNYRRVEINSTYSHLNNILIISQTKIKFKKNTINGTGNVKINSPQLNTSLDINIFKHLDDENNIMTTDTFLEYNLKDRYNNIKHDSLWISKHINSKGINYKFYELVIKSQNNGELIINFTKDGSFNGKNLMHAKIYHNCSSDSILKLHWILISNNYTTFGSSLKLEDKKTKRGNETTIDSSKNFLEIKLSKESENEKFNVQIKSKLDNNRAYFNCLTSKLIGDYFSLYSIKLNLTSNYRYLTNMTFNSNYALINNGENMFSDSELNIICPKSHFALIINGSSENTGNNKNTLFNIISTYYHKDDHKCDYLLNYKIQKHENNASTSLTINLRNNTVLNINATLKVAPEFKKLIEVNFDQKTNNIQSKKLRWIHFSDHSSFLKEYLYYSKDNEILAIDLGSFFNSNATYNLAQNTKQINVFLQVESENHEIKPFNVSALINYQLKNILIVRLNASYEKNGQSMILFQANYEKFPQVFNYLFNFHSSSKLKDKLILSSLVLKTTTGYFLLINISLTCEKIKKVFISNMINFNESFIIEGKLEHNDKHLHYRKEIKNNIIDDGFMINFCKVEINSTNPQFDNIIILLQTTIRFKGTDSFGKGVLNMISPHLNATFDAFHHFDPDHNHNSTLIILLSYNLKDYNNNNIKQDLISLSSRGGLKMNQIIYGLEMKSKNSGQLNINMSASVKQLLIGVCYYPQSINDSYYNFTLNLLNDDLKAFKIYLLIEVDDKMFLVSFNSGIKANKSDGNKQIDMSLNYNSSFGELNFLNLKGQLTKQNSNQILLDLKVSDNLYGKSVFHIDSDQYLKNLYKHLSKRKF